MKLLLLIIMVAWPLCMMMLGEQGITLLFGVALGVLLSMIVDLIFKNQHVNGDVPTVVATQPPRLESAAMPDAQRPTNPATGPRPTDAQRPTPNARRPTPDAQRPTPNARRPTNRTINWGDEE